MGEHPCWASGLGISSCVAALRPDLVQPVDHETAASKLKPGFGYDKDPTPNKENVTPLFRSCVELHPGVCRSDALFEKVVFMVHQMKAHFDVNDISVPALFQVEACTPTSNALQPLASRTKNWYMLGSIRKRPVCHILAKYIPLQSVPNSVAPELDPSSGSFRLVSSYEITLSCLELAKRETEDWENMQVRLRRLDFNIVEGCKVPNHIVVTGEGECFCIGPNLEVPTATKRKPAPTKMRFGLTTSRKDQGCKRKRTEPSKSKNTAAADLDLPDFGFGLYGDGSGDNADGNNDDDDQDIINRVIGKKEVVEEAYDDAFPAKLNLMQFKELKKAVEACRGAEQDDQDVEEEDRSGSTSSSKSSRRRTQNSSRAESNILASSSKAECQQSGPEEDSQTQPQVRGVHFNKRCGILSMNVVKRKSTCFLCKQNLGKGETRFQISTSLKRPEQSAHPGCVSQIPPFIYQPSMEWIESELQRPGLTTEEFRILQEAGYSLRCMMNACAACE